MQGTLADRPTSHRARPHRHYGIAGRPSENLALGVATSRFISGRGPLTTLRSAIDHEYAEQTEEEAAEPEEYPEEET